MTGRRARPNGTCDAPGCDVAVPRGKLMCRAHWFATPKPLRDAINESWKAGRYREWFGHCLDTRRFHAGQPAPAPAPAVTPERFQARQAQMLGER